MICISSDRFLEPVPLSAAFSVPDQSPTLRVPDVLPHVPYVKTCSGLWSLFWDKCHPCMLTESVRHSSPNPNRSTENSLF